MQTFNPQNLNDLRARLNAVLKEFDANLEFDIGKITYNAAECTVPLKVKIKGAAPEKTMLGRVMIEFGLQENSTMGKYKLVDYRPRQYKFPFIYQDAQGRRFKTTEEHARIMFAKKAA